MTVDRAQPLRRRKVLDRAGTRRTRRSKTERRHERAPHIDALIRLVPVRVVRVADLILRIGTLTWDRFGLKNTDLRILAILGAYQPISVNEISRRTHIDKAWISRSSRGLLRRKLIAKSAHPADSRASSLSLTGKGEALLRKIAPIAQEYQRQLLQGQRTRDVERVLDSLAARAEEMFQAAAQQKSRTKSRR
ncbi:MAG TPA: MarR family transcriptional regulator [Candidatus Acidoferrales bacterium]|nr:MarR family transcriptional regulator [Candidatus Acidoferrales bacterium]